ncbi:MAG: MnmC family methyltransferase [Prochlorococcaceae cyanobacterium]
MVQGPSQQDLSPRITADGSFSLYSSRFGEAFHSAAGAALEARNTFVGPAALTRFAPGSTVVVVDVCVGTGSNTAALLEACSASGLQMQWHGLELDPAPLQLAIADAGFCRQWTPEALAPLRQLAAGDRWSSPWGQGRLLWGDARQQVAVLTHALAAQVDLVLLDAFSPRHCPELWTLEFLGALTELLAPAGRLLTYCSAAAVRASLLQLDLQVTAIRAAGSSHSGSRWSGGTAASWGPLVTADESLADPWLRPLSPMEQEHLRTGAAQPYRDPSGQASAHEILAAREQLRQQSAARGALQSTSAWRRRWGLERRT